MSKASRTGGRTQSTVRRLPYQRFLGKLTTCCHSGASESCKVDCQDHREAMSCITRSQQELDERCLQLTAHYCPKQPTCFQSMDNGTIMVFEKKLGSAAARVTVVLECGGNVKSCPASKASR